MDENHHNLYLPMDDLDINHLPYKLPLAAIALLTLALSATYLLGIVEIEVGHPQPRLLLIFGGYLLVLAAIIFMHKRINVKLSVHLKSSEKRSSE